MRIHAGENTRIVVKRAGIAAALTFGLGLALAGCVSAPAPASRTSVWSPPAAAQRTDQTWRDLRAARRPDLKQPLSLAALSDLALQNAPSTRQAWAQARAASAQVDQANGYFLPTLTATAGITRRGIEAQPDSFDQGSMVYGPGLQLNYLVINFGGGRSAAVEQAMQTVYAANFTFNGAIQDVLLAVAMAYYDRVSAESEVTAAETSVNDAKQALDAAKARNDAGLGTQLDVLQTQSSYDEALFNLAGARGHLRTAQGSLVQSVGLPSDTPLAVVAPVADMPDALTQTNLTSLIESAIRQRPDIAALRATVAAREAAVRVAAAPLWPSLYLNGSLAQENYAELGGTPGNQGLQDNDWAYSAGVSLQWTVFDGFQTRSAKRAALAQAEAARAQLQSAELAVSAEVWKRHADYETAVQRYSFATSFESSGSAAYNLALNMYRSGLKTILDLLNAEQQLAQARSQRIAARQAVFTTLATLAHAVGVMEPGGRIEVGE